MTDDNDVVQWIHDTVDAVHFAGGLCEVHVVYGAFETTITLRTIKTIWNNPPTTD